MYFNKDGDVLLEEVAGRLSSIAKVAAKNEMDKIFGKVGYDTSYWSFDLTMRFKELATDSFEVLDEVTVFSKGYEETKA